jgi:hypothetical protein
LKGLIFGVEVKREDTLTVQFDGLNKFVSNDHPYGEKMF